MTLPSLADAAWLKDPPLQQVLAALAAAGAKRASPAARSATR
jgi:hypothetical protein